jgi:SAM-dependent methyltransferase
MVEDYLRLQSRIHCYEVPTKLHAAYEEVIHLLRRHPDAQGFENQRWDKQRLDQMALRSHAMQHYRLFSTHFYKVLHALISLENYVELQEPLCIDRPYLSVLDIGCGGGAASNALLTFIDNYQELHVINKVPISNVEIRFFGIDPSQTVELIYQNMLKQHSILVSDNLLTTNSHYIAESFNQDTIEILKGQINEGEHIVFVAMSNVVRPLWQQWTKLLPRMAFGTTEGELLLQFVDQIPIDKLVVLNVATQEHGTDSRWGKQLGILLSAIWQLVTGSGHQYWTTGVKETHIEFMNFPASYWVEQRGREASDTTFYQSLSVITHRSYLRDDEWHKTLAHSNLELAWARARYYLNYESLTDRVEIALFDYRLQEHLLKLRKWWEGYRWNHLNTEHACSFLEPKASAAQTRPKMVCRFEESIVSTAIIQKHGWLASNNQQSSYSHRLNTPLDDASEYLYHYWLQKYKDYIEDAQSAVEKQENIVVINTDISSFYTNINRNYSGRPAQAGGMKG